MTAFPEKYSATLEGHLSDAGTEMQEQRAQIKTLEDALLASHALLTGTVPSGMTEAYLESLEELVGEINERRGE
jgi:hypothetical protein